MTMTGVASPDARQRIIRWVATQVMPHEAGVRAWLRRYALTGEDIDDLIQEAYCRISSLDSVEHISAPDGYFFLIARNLLYDRMRRARVVRFEAIQEIEALGVDTDEPTPEDITAGRRELARVQGLIAALPDELREVITLRKVEGLSQKEIAARLNITEARVEHLGVRAMKALMRSISETKVWDEETERRTRDGRSPKSPRD